MLDIKLPTHVDEIPMNVFTKKHGLYDDKYVRKSGKWHITNLSVIDRPIHDVIVLEQYLKYMMSVIVDYLNNHKLNHMPFPWDMGKGDD